MRLHRHIAHRPAAATCLYDLQRYTLKAKQKVNPTIIYEQISKRPSTHVPTCKDSMAAHMLCSCLSIYDDRRFSLPMCVYFHSFNLHRRFLQTRNARRHNILAGNSTSDPLSRHSSTNIAIDSHHTHVLLYYTYPRLTGPMSLRMTDALCSTFQSTIPTYST